MPKTRRRRLNSLEERLRERWQDYIDAFKTKMNVEHRISQVFSAIKAPKAVQHRKHDERVNVSLKEIFRYATTPQLEELLEEYRQLYNCEMFMYKFARRAEKTGLKPGRIKLSKTTRVSEQAVSSPLSKTERGFYLVIPELSRDYISWIKKELEQRAKI